MIPVLFIANAPEVRLGGQVNLMRLLERLDRRRFRPVVLVCREGSLSRRSRELGAEIEILSLTRMEPQRVYAWATNVLPTIRLVQVLRAHRIRLVYVDSRDHLPPAWLASRIAKASVVWHVQTSASAALDGIFLRLADHVICCSEAVDRRFAAWPTPRALVPNSVDTERFAPGGPEPANRREVTLLYLGEHTAAKGLFDLLRVFARVCARSADVRLEIGGPSGPPWIEALLRVRARGLGLGDRVRWIGFCKDQVELLRSADVFVFFSHSEGLSLAVLEAMACGLPVVASDIPANL
ncbi:MAG: glycosyltransferase family 4 protein, partial [Acidobacteria bacterium]|nr:glycosyltransferase family 4 protein [Acidobacteriota bacterium]